MASTMNAAATVGLFVQLEANPGREEDAATFLRGALALAQDEPLTTTWYAIRFGPATFGIFDTFSDEIGRRAHLRGKIAAALKERAPELFVDQPRIQEVDVLAAKIP